MPCADPEELADAPEALPSPSQPFLRTGHAGILPGSESGAQYMRNGALHEAIDSIARNNIVVDAAPAGLGSIAGDNVRFEM